MRRLLAAALALGLFMVGSAQADWDNNAGFESAYTNAWYSFNPGETTNSSAFTRNGSNFSLEIATPTVVPDDVPGGNLPAYTVVDWPHNSATPGGTFTASSYYYVDQALANHERLGIGLFWLDSSGGFISGDWETVFGPEISTGGSNFPTGSETVGAWTLVEVTSTAPINAAFMQVALEVRGGGSNVYFDDVEVIPEPASFLLVGMGMVLIAGLRRKLL